VPRGEAGSATDCDVDHNEFSPPPRPTTVGGPPPGGAKENPSGRHQHKSRYRTVREEVPPGFRSGSASACSATHARRTFACGILPRSPARKDARIRARNGHPCPSRSVRHPRLTWHLCCRTGLDASRAVATAPIAKKAGIPARQKKTLPCPSPDRHASVSIRSPMSSTISGTTAEDQP